MWPSEFSRAIAGFDDLAVWLTAGVDPHHRHRLFRSVQETMGDALGNEGCVTSAQLVLLPLDKADGGALHNGDRLVEIMDVTGQRRVRQKPAIAPTDAYGAEPASEQVAKECVL